MARLRFMSTLVTMCAMLLSIAATTPATAASATPYIGLRRENTAAHFAGAARSGVVVEDRAGRAHIRLGSTGLGAGSNATLFGTSARYYYGRLVSPVTATSHPFDRAVGSWNAATPEGTWLQLELRAYRAADRHWTKYYTMGIWTSGSSPVRRRSVRAQGDADGTVATDTLELVSNRYTHYQYRLTLYTLDRSVTPSVGQIAMVTSDQARELSGLGIVSDRQAWGKDLWTPRLSQREYEGGGGWCSPTSTAMVMKHWGTDIPVPEVAAGIHDYVWGGTGNWPFNTAYAALHGFDAYVTRMTTFSQVEEWISAGVPVVISVAWAEGELSNAFRSASDGHIIVVRGFTSTGQVIVNDPAAPTKYQARKVYDRAQLTHVWRKYSGGTVYLIYPKGHPIPTDKRYGSW